MSADPLALFTERCPLDERQWRMVRGPYWRSSAVQKGLLPACPPDPNAPAPSLLGLLRSLYRDGKVVPAVP